MLIVITGAIASGKSAVARELKRELERRGVLADVIDLDLVYESIAGDAPKSDAATWAAARRESAIRANSLAANGVAVVIAEGSYNSPEDRQAFTRHLGPRETPLFVTLLVGYDEALRRAQSDPTRGLSRDPDFLRAYFDAAERARASVSIPAGDFVIDTEQTTVAAAAIAIALRAGSETAG